MISTSSALTLDGNHLKFLRNGDWVSYNGGRSIAIRSPVDGSLVGLVPARSKETIDEVFQRAREAQKGQAEAGLEERVACLYRAAGLMEKYADDFVEILSWEIAKNRRDAREEATGIAQQLEVGSVQINGKSARGPDHFPFVGIKASGMGAQGVRYSIESMTRIKAIVFSLHEWQGFSGL